MNAQTLINLLDTGARAQVDRDGCRVIMSDGETLPTQISTINAAKATASKELLIRRHLMSHLTEILLPEYDDPLEQRWIIRTLITPKGIECTPLP